MERDKNRFFSRKQVEEYEELNGEGCEWEVEKGVRCGKHAESTHIQPYSKGGATELDNMGRACKPHHALQHALDNESYSSKLIWSRMTDEEKEMTIELAKPHGFKKK